MNKNIRRLIGTTTLLILSACARPDHISISGSTTVLPAVSKSAESFSVETGQIVVVNAGGELARFPQITFKPIAIGRDAVAPVVSSEVFDAGVTNLSFNDIAAIYRGEIDNWNHLGGPDQPILVIDKESSSGTRQTFMEVVMGDSSAEAAGADLVIGSNNEEQTAITQSNAAIGMLSHAWLNDDVKGLAIRMDDGSLINPTLETIKSGQFPITRDLNIIVRNDISPSAQSFVDYLLGERGQAFVADSGYIPVR